ncbi:phosphate ABC transporter substrate-binding protein PstS [Dactylosporangium cerinum]|uniref:Phosphate ABC transporter substrate-binding protein PstS n=1 Tax=Dactylosporangium cerinum TaxID=1434730 RepID=A0ABV9WB56_9ACTN
MRGKSIIASCLAAVLVVATSPGTARAAPAHARIEGTGSTFAANALNDWVAGAQLQGLQADYTPTGSVTGRKDFAAVASDFGVSDLPFRGRDPKTGQIDDAQGRPYAYAPLVAGALAFPYQVRIGGALVRDLRLSGLTLAKIFLGQITNWNDPQITADNAGRKLPSLPIIVVVHSEASGATAQLTAYLAKQYPSLWQQYNGTSAWTEYFPTTPRTGTRPRPIAVNGSDGVMNTVSAGSSNGAIGYSEYSYAFGAGYPVAKVRNAAGYFIAPDPLNVSLSLTRATLNPDLTVNLDGVYASADPRVYPLSGYTYLILPTGNDARMDTGKRQTMVDFFSYTACGGQHNVSSAGYAPLPLNLVRAQFDQLRKLHDIDPAVDVSTLDPARCNNPTFYAGDLARDRLGEIVPLPSGAAAPEPVTVPALAQNDTAPYAGEVSIRVTLGTRVSLTQLDPATPDGHPAQATDPTGHRHAWVFQGDLGGIAVADTRPGQPGWTVTGQATDMVNGTTTVAAGNLGWSPALVRAGSDAEGTVTAGPPVRPALQTSTSPGLAEAAVLAGAPRGAGLGVQYVAATVHLWMPDTSPKGQYTGTLTLTLISA